jgi:hypothetical protein
MIRILIMAIAVLRRRGWREKLQLGAKCRRLMLGVDYGYLFRRLRRKVRSHIKHILFAQLRRLW